VIRATKIRRRLALRREEGMTVVEVMVAGVIMVLGGLAVLQLVDAAARNNFRAEQSQVVSNRLQEEMEKIKQLPYDQVALTGLPADTSDLTDPRWRVSGTNYATTQQGGDPRPLLYNGSALYGGGTVNGGAIDPTPIPFQGGDVHGNIYRFVVWENDATCSDLQCPGQQDLKKVVVAVRLDSTSSGGTRHYQELQGELVDPEVTPADNENPIPPGEDDSKPWTFFLTDTTCDHTTRQPITSDHLTHNTRGKCSTGQTSGNNPGAPDLMFTEAPPFDAEQPLYDYATDVEPGVNPGEDKGLQLLPQSGAGCVIDALNIPVVPDLLEPDKFQKVHKWVSPAIPTGFDIQLDGEGTLDLWTQTVNGASHSGKICIWLFQRQINILGIPIDTPAVSVAGGLNYFTYSQSSWPTSWTEIHIPLSFILNVHLLPNTRLGLAIAIDRSGTGDGSQGLQFMYDEPSFDSRLEVKTHSLLPIF
jgi:type II secretory pathway pseudopilin PulG